MKRSFISHFAGGAALRLLSADIRFFRLSIGLYVVRLGLVTVLGLLMVGLTPRVEAAAGALDPTFGSLGKVRTPLDPVSGETLYSIAIQADGKIVAAGFGPSGGGGVGIVRYNSDGSLDSSFGSGGIVMMDLLLFSGAHAVTVLGDGKIVIAGQASDGTLSRFGLARLNPDGTPDSTFGPSGDGRSVASVVPYSMYTTSLSVQTDGGLIAAGRIDHGGEPVGPAQDFGLVRYTTNGLNDMTFGPAATSVVSTDFFSHNDLANAVALQADGKIVAAGVASTTGSASSNDFALARYLSNGSLDAAFGAGGKVITDFELAGDEVRDAVILSDGKILAGGVATHGGSGGVRAFALARYHVDGSLDGAFGIGGKTTTDFAAGPSLAEALAVQSDGKIILAGTVVNSDYGTAWALARYHSDGSLDPSFGTAGKVVTDFYSGVDIAHTVAIQTDGKIVAGGMGYADEYYPGTPGAIGWDFTLARYLGDPLPADVVLTKMGTPSPVAAGGTLTYTLTITNHGPGDANDVVVADALPPEVSSTSISATGGGVIDTTSGTLTVEWPSLAAGDTETVTIITAVDAEVVDGTVITNTALVEASSLDPNTTNNHAAFETTIMTPHAVTLYLHGKETARTAGRLTMNFSSTISSKETIQLWKDAWLSAPDFTGTFQSGATATLTLSKVIGRSAGATFRLSATDLAGNNEVLLGEASQVIGASTSPDIITIPIAAPVTLTDQRIKLSVTTASGVNLKLEPNTLAWLELTAFVGSP